jgi:nicotinamidase-related amidase
MRKMICLFLLTLIVSMAPVLAGDQEEQKETRMKPALLVIDIQNRYLPYMSGSDKEMALEMINGAIWLFRQNGYPVIRVYNTHPEWGPEPGTELFEFPSTIAVTEDDPKVVKNHPSSFKGTDLEKILKEKDRNTLFLCGLSATGCVLATYFGAQDLDYDVFMIQKAILSDDAGHTDLIEQITNSVNFTTMRVMLENAHKDKDS